MDHKAAVITYINDDDDDDDADGGCPVRHVVLVWL